MGIPAIIKGKTDRNREDMLTSTLFQAISYLPVEKALIPILESARNTKGETLPIKRFIGVKSAEYIYWPTLSHKIPDLIIHLLDDNKDILIIVLIEAKLFSPKSGEAELDDNDMYIAYSDQLEGEYSDLKSYISHIHCCRYLLYLTAHLTMPKKDILSSELHMEPDKIYWLNYYSIHHILKQQLSQPNPNNTESRVVTDIISLLENYGFFLFNKWDYSKYFSLQPYHYYYISGGT